MRRSHTPRQGMKYECDLIEIGIRRYYLPSMCDKELLIKVGNGNLAAH